MKAVRRFFLKIAVTPERTRKLVARILSMFLQWATETKAWDAVSALPRWLRKLADFIDRWNAAVLPEEKDRLIAELVKYAVTDESVERLIDTVVGLEAHIYPNGSRLLSRPELIRLLKDSK